MKAEAQQFLTGTLDAGGLLDRLQPQFPWIGDLADTPQDPEWHAEGNVRIHTEMVLDALRCELEVDSIGMTDDQRIVLVIGAALHDIGKTRTTKQKLLHGRERIVSPNHADTGRSYAAPRLAASEDLDDSIFHQALGIIGYHHHPRKLLSGTMSPGRFARIARSLPLHFLWIFERADLKGRISGNLDDKLEELDLFRLEAENLGLWPGKDPYENWKGRLRDELGVTNEDEADFVFHAARYNFEHGKIHTLEEAIGKTYEARKNHGRLLLLCGPSGSGKSTWIEKNQAADIRVISLDDLREEIGGKRAKQSHNGQVVQAARELLKQGLRDKATVAWDATNLRKDRRQALVQTAHDYGAASEIVRFAVPPGELEKRNRKRTHAVPSTVLQRQLDRFQWPDLWEAHRVCTVR